MAQNQISINKIEVLKGILDQSFIIAITDKNGTITYTNKKFSEVSKYTNEELVGQNHNMLKSGFHHDEFYSTIWKKISNGETWCGEIKNRAKDGSLYWIETTIVPFLDNTDIPEQYIAVSNDITLHKENEEKLKTQSKDLEKKFKGLYDKAPTLLRTISLDGIILDCNEAYWKGLGYTKEETIGKNILEHTARLSFQEMADNLSDWKKTGETRHSEIWMKRKDGSIFACLLNGTNLHDENGILIGRILSLTDLTEIHNAREMLKHQESILKDKYSELSKTFQLLESKEKSYRSLYDKSPGLLLTISSNGAIIDCNETYAKALGYSKKEIVGMACYDHIAEISKEDLKKDIEMWKTRQDVQPSEIWMTRKDGTDFPVLLNGTTLYDEKGNVEGRTMVLTDLTEIYETRRKLEHNESTIREQYDALKRSDTAKDEFSSMITHELKTPLTPIKGHCEILNDPQMMGELNSEQSQSVNEIYVNAVRLERLIADILDVQKLDMNKMSFNKIEFDIKDFIFSIERDLGRLMKEKQIEFMSNVNRFSMNSDKDRIYQVLNNLIKNSIDFVPAGKGRIEVGAYPKDSNVIWYVKDNGIGIPVDKQGNIFKKFYQTDTSVSRKHGGTGLGLAICKGIVEGQGGKIWFESKQGENTTFYFSLPA